MFETFFGFKKVPSAMNPMLNSYSNTPDGNRSKPGSSFSSTIAAPDY